MKKVINKQTFHTVNDFILIVIKFAIPRAPAAVTTRGMNETCDEDGNVCRSRMSDTRSTTWPA